MGADLLSERQQAHSLIDVLPIEKVTVVLNLLEVLAEPLSRSLAAAEVDEDELSDDAVAALKRADASLDSGEGLSHTQFLREFQI